MDGQGGARATGVGTWTRGVRAVAAALCVAAAILAGPRAAQAADATGYPARPVRIVVPFSAGSPPDVIARLVGERLSTALGQSVVVDNRPGASGNIGADLVAKSPPDGHTLLLSGSLITLLPSTMGAVAVDPVTAFAPVTKLGEAHMLIVAHPSLGVATLPELVARARGQPGKVAYATAGIGTVQHLIASIISQKAGIEMIHVPHTNSAKGLADVLAGEVPVFVTVFGPINAALKSGQLRPLAVASKRRAIEWPDIPTVAEVGYEEATVSAWNGVLAPAGTPPEIVDRLYRELDRIVQQPEVRERLLRMGVEARSVPPDQFGAEIREAVLRWPPVVRAAGIRPQ